MGRVSVALRLGVILAAATAALAPWPEARVESYYAQGLYPAVQTRVTSWSNTTGVSLFDPLVGLIVVGLAVAWVRWLRASLSRRTPWPLLRGASTTAVVAAVVYLWFQIVWGLNYARPALQEAIGYDESRVTGEALHALADRAVREVNRLYTPAHALGFPQPSEVPPALVRALWDVERQLGRPTPTTPGRPKRTGLAPFFRAAGVDGMHAPFLLETLINPDLTPVERPAVLAHEWAHLAGYAPESDASFVGLVVAARADNASRYSAWLALLHETVTELPSAQQRGLLARLGPGPQSDRAAIAARLQSRIEIVSQASWRTYDQYLKAQGVSEGIRSYSRVVQLMLGSGAMDPGWQPPGAQP
ncbi:MAG: DUF3810 family protein [Acidobacteriota bacterium]